MRFLLLLFVLLAACGPRRPTEATPPSPVAIPFAPTDVACCVSLEQHVEVTSPYGAAAFDVFVESHETELVLVGFTSYGVRAFTIVHDAAGLHVDAAPMRELAAVPFDRVVRDVYAAFLVDADVASGSTTIDDARVEGYRRGRRVVFEADTERPDEVTIDYGVPGWAAGDAPPSEVVVDHHQPALRIRITTRPPSPPP